MPGQPISDDDPVDIQPDEHMAEEPAAAIEGIVEDPPVEEVASNQADLADKSKLSRDQLYRRWEQADWEFFDSKWSTSPQIWTPGALDEYRNARLQIVSLILDAHYP